MSSFESCSSKLDIHEITEKTYFAIMAPASNSFSSKFKTEALKYVEEKGCSTCAAARHFGIDENDIRGWKIQSDSLHTMIKNRFSKAKQLPGSGRRPFSEDLEELVYQWIRCGSRAISNIRKTSIATMATPN